MATHEQHAAMLKEVREDIAKAEAQIAEWRVVEKYHERHANGYAQPVGNGQPAPASTSSVDGGEGQGIQPEQIAHMSHVELAMKILRSARRPLTVGQMIETVPQLKHLVGSNRRTYYNGIFTAMLRRKDLFCRNDKREWSLLEWKNDPG